MIRKDETGKRYGRLLVEEETGCRLNDQPLYLCRCDCGNSKLVTGRVLRDGRVVSCGCYRREKAITHGCSGPKGKRSREYGSWATMIQRCTNSRCPGYLAYGARGITVCDRWRSFADFLEDVGQRPPGTTLDRIDNSRGYEPGNCRWATAKQQGRNKADVKLSEAVVAEIRKEMAAGARNRDLAPKYGVHNSVVSRIRHRRAWA